MWKFVVLRVLVIIPILFAVIFIVFTIMNIIPGNPARMILGDFATQEAIDLFNEQHGLDLPFFQRFFNYIWNIVTRFDFGISYRTRRPVVDEIITRFPNTFNLAFFSVLGSSVIGIPAGIIMAAKGKYWVDRTVNIVALVFASVPIFILCIFVLYVFAVRLEWFPVFGIATWRGYVLPLSVMIFPAAVGRMRMSRIVMLETIRLDYVTLARAKGVPEHRVIFVHALKNSLIMIITSILMSFSGMLGGAIFVENVFAIPGLGQYIILGIRMQDTPVVMATTIFMAAIFCFNILLLDIIYAFIDPRIKGRYMKSLR